MSEEQKKEVVQPQEEENDLSWLSEPPTKHPPSTWPYVYICAPRERHRAGDEDEYFEARAFEALIKANCARAIQMGYIPLIPGMYLDAFSPGTSRKYTDVRDALIYQWMNLAKEVWVITERATEDTKAELAVAESLGKPVYHMKAMIHF